MKLPNMTKKQKWIVAFKIFTWIAFVVALVMRLSYLAVTFGLFVAWDGFNIMYDRMMKKKNVV